MSGWLGRCGGKGWWLDPWFGLGKRWGLLVCALVDFWLRLKSRIEAMVRQEGFHGGILYSVLYGYESLEFVSRTGLLLPRLGDLKGSFSDGTTHSTGLQVHVARCRILIYCNLLSKGHMCLNR